MQLLTWMLIVLHGGLSAAAAPVGAEPHFQITANRNCPTLQAPPFAITSAQPRASRTQRAVADDSVSLTAENRTQTPVHSVFFDLRVGRLKPQVETLLRDHFAIQHMVWNAPEGLVWPSDFKLQATDPTALVESLLEPYNLQMRVYANHTAVIQPIAYGARL